MGREGGGPTAAWLTPNCRRFTCMVCVWWSERGNSFPPRNLFLNFSFLSLSAEVLPFHIISTRSRGTRGLNLKKIAQPPIILVHLYKEYHKILTKAHKTIKVRHRVRGYTRPCRSMHIAGVLASCMSQCCWFRAERGKQPTNKQITTNIKNFLIPSINAIDQTLVPSLAKVKWAFGRGTSFSPW